MDPRSLTYLGLPALAWIAVLPLLGAFINLTLGRYFSKSWVHTVAIGAVAASCVLSGVLVFWGLFQHAPGAAEPLWKTGGIAQTAWSWLEVGGFKAELAFRLDSLSAVMIMIITFVGTWIHIYSTGYMAHDPGYARYFGYLNLFTGAMLILVLAANLPVMFIGWEGVGLCSFLLIGFWYENEDYANAGRKAFVVNRIGDFCFLLGMFLLYWAVKSLDFADLKNVANGAAYISNEWGANHATVWGSERLAAAAGILLFVGACGKSAQLPLFVWLPDAMAGPTPVSALIHAATMVTAGVYMVCRLSFLYSTSTTASIVVATIGLLTALVAAFIAFAQTDLKKVLAYSTVSQLGFMFVAAGTGNYTAAVFHLGTHAFFKACLFLGAGSVMHGMEHGGAHTPGDITKMGGLRKHMPITRITFLISCLAIAGIFPFAGFFSKDEILGGEWGAHPPGWGPYGRVLWAGLLVAALGTAFYMWRLYFLVFAGNERSEEAKHAHESPASMTSALAILALFATIAGFIGIPHLTSLHLPESWPSLAHWLEPSVTHSWYVTGTEQIPMESEAGDAMTIELMAIALGVALVGIAGAWVLYGRGPSRSLARIVNGPLAGAYQASKHKLWFDEIYDAAIVRPFRILARGLFEIVDRFIIDTVAINGSAFVVGLFGRLARWFQNGQVQRYLAGLVVGGALVFWVTDCHRHATFEIRAQGDQLILHAEPGYGVVGTKAKLHWHLDGSTDCAADKGKPSQPADLTVRAGDAGAVISLCIDDFVARKPFVVSKRVPNSGEGTTL